jgi:hypothetical protein
VMGVLWLALVMVLVTFNVILNQPSATTIIVTCVVAPYVFACFVCAFSIVPIVTFAHAEVTDCAGEFFQDVMHNLPSASMQEDDAFAQGRVAYSLDLIVRNRKHLFNTSLAMTPVLAVLIAGFFTELVLLIAAIVELARVVGPTAIPAFFPWCFFFGMFLVFFLGCAAHVTRSHQSCLSELRRGLIESDELSAHAWRLQLLLATSDDDSLKVAGISVTPALTISVASVFVSLVGFFGTSGALSK